MACNVGKSSFLRVVAKRGYAASAAPRLLGHPAEVQVTTLGNKAVVATASSTLPISRVSVVFRAGSRFESYDHLGAAHLLSIAGNLSTKNASGFIINRSLQQVGANYRCTADRESVAYTVETTSDNLECALKWLQELVEPAFKPWELEESTKRVKAHLAARTPRERAIDLLHRAAYRTTLGNSTLIPKWQVGRLSSESLQHYFASNCTAGRCAVIGVGVDHNELSGFTQTLPISNGEGKVSAASYYGGDARKDTAGNIAHVAVAGQGAGLNSKDALAFQIYRCAVGVPVTKRGTANGTLGKALASAIGSKASINYEPLNFNYSDSGLFGFYVSTDSENICQAVDALTKALKSGAVSADDIKRGKAVLKSAILEQYSTDAGVFAHVQAQAALLRQVQSADSLLAAVDKVSDQDVQAAAKRAGSSKLSIGAVGNLGHVPYASDLA